MLYEVITPLHLSTGKLRRVVVETMVEPHALAWFLASWAKVLSWKETARRFGTSWDSVFRAVEQAVLV